MAVISTLRVAPVKGLSTVRRSRVRLDADGVAEDRRLFLVNAGGAVVTLRSHPEFVQVRPDLDLEAGVLRVVLPDGGEVASALTEDGERVQARLYGKDRIGSEIGGDVAAALTRLAGEPIRLVLGDATGVGWDEGPVSLVGRASTTAVGGAELDRARYRMLIEVDETEPFEEDEWVGCSLELGQARIAVSHQLVRCVIITQSPTTGDKDWDGLHALTELGRSDLCLGVIADVVVPGEVAVGDEVRVVTAGGQPSDKVA